MYLMAGRLSFLVLEEVRVLRSRAEGRRDGARSRRHGGWQKQFGDMSETSGTNVYL
jgi:hypothetical protein